MTKRGQQLEVPGTEAPDLPHIREAIYAWEDAKEKASSEGKQLRDAAKAAEAKALELVAEAGLKSYAFIDRESGKRKRFFGASETKAKTVRAPNDNEKQGRKDDAPTKDAEPKPTKAERDATRVESRRVTRTEEHDRAADPFGATRGLLDEARERQAAEGTDETDPLVIPDDAPEAEEPAPRPSRPKSEKFDAQMLADGLCALRFDGGNACSLAVGHNGLHKSSSHNWKARRPKPSDPGEAAP